MPTKTASIEKYWNLERYWIDQPSTTQEHHDLHGRLVLVRKMSDGWARVYFTHGDVIDTDMRMAALSKGWPQHLRLNMGR